MSRVALPQLERDFQAAVVELAKLNRWLVFHPWSSLNSQAGWPDLFLVRGERAVAMELKGPKTRVRPEQLVWLAALDKVEGIETYLLRPTDWDRIERILARQRKEST